MDVTFCIPITLIPGLVAGLPFPLTQTMGSFLGIQLPSLHSFSWLVCSSCWAIANHGLWKKWEGLRKVILNNLLRLNEESFLNQKIIENTCTVGGPFIQVNSQYTLPQKKPNFNFWIFLGDPGQGSETPVMYWSTLLPKRKATSEKLCSFRGRVYTYRIYDRTKVLSTTFLDGTFS